MTEETKPSLEDQLEEAKSFFETLQKPQLNTLTNQKNISTIPILIPASHSQSRTPILSS